MEKQEVYNELKEFCAKYHPFIEQDKEELTARTNLALQTYNNCIKNGWNNDYAKHEAYIVLYNGLNFSLFELVQDIIEDKKLKFTQQDKFAKHMCILFKHLLDKYEINDEFNATTEYDTLRKELDEHISKFIRDTGLDQE